MMAAETVGGSGFTVDDLADYADRGRVPSIAAIDGSPECLAVLDSLERLSTLSRELIAGDAETETVDEHWLGSILATIGREVRAGRDLFFASNAPRVRTSITEGAVRELVRSAGDSVAGVVVGSCGLAGADAVTVSVTISVLMGEPLVPAAEETRRRVLAALELHTPLVVDAVDVTVVDVHELGVAA